jgi:hypothetical protein
MPLSRHKTIAQDVVDFLDANWSAKPDGVQILRADSFEAAVKAIDDGNETGFIPVIVPRVASTFGDRETDLCETPVFVCVIGSVPGLDQSLIDAWDLRAEQVADVLRDRSLKRLQLPNNILASRKETVSMPTTADADFLYSSEIFFSVIEMRYVFSVPVGSVA